MRLIFYQLCGIILYRTCLYACFWLLLVVASLIQTCLRCLLDSCTVLVMSCIYIETTVLVLIFSAAVVNSMYLFPCLCDLHLSMLWFVTVCHCSEITLKSFCIILDNPESCFEHCMLMFVRRVVYVLFIDKCSCLLCTFIITFH